jgi:hypothetical protein
MDEREIGTKQRGEEGEGEGDEGQRKKVIITFFPS